MKELEIKNIIFELKVLLKYVTPELTIARLGTSYFVNLVDKKRLLIEGEEDLRKFLAEIK